VLYVEENGSCAREEMLAPRIVIEHLFILVYEGKSVQYCRETKRYTRALYKIYYNIVRKHYTRYRYTIHTRIEADVAGSGPYSTKSFWAKKSSND
jgi:hypothetical protein